MACVSEGEVPASANRYQLTGSEGESASFEPSPALSPQVATAAAMNEFMY